MEFGPIIKSLLKRKAFALLIVLQVAITQIALTTSVVVTGETLREWNLPSGLDQQNIVAIYPQIFDDNLELQQVVENDIAQLSKIPGITQITPAANIPFSARGIDNIFNQLGDEAQSYQTNIFNFNHRAVEVLGIKLINGRNFTSQDVVTQDPTVTQNKPAVVLISDTMAKAMFEAANPVGETIYLEKEGYPVEIIGVYSGFMNGEQLNGEGMSYRSVIRPLVEYSRGEDPRYIVRVEPGKNEAFLEDIRNVLYQTPGRYIELIEFLTRTQKRMYDGRGSSALIMLFISFTLLIITSIGISGLISFLVAQQKKQIGTRRALGAKKWQIIRYYLVENSLISLLGIFIGSIIALALLVLMADYNGLELTSLIWIPTIGLFIWIISLSAALRPAILASRVAPATVTRGG